MSHECTEEDLMLLVKCIFIEGTETILNIIDKKIIIDGEHVSEFLKISTQTLLYQLVENRDEKSILTIVHNIKKNLPNQGYTDPFNRLECIPNQEIVRQLTNFLVLLKNIEYYIAEKGLESFSEWIYEEYLVEHMWMKYNTKTCDEADRMILFYMRLDAKYKKAFLMWLKRFSH